LGDDVDGANCFSSLGSPLIFQNWNVGLFKKFMITEQAGFEFRAEAFNFVNHPNWDVGSLGVDGNNQTTLGKVTNKNSERNLQLSLRFSF